MRLRRNSVSALVTAVVMAAIGVSAATPVASGEVPGRTETVYPTSSPVTSVVASKVTLAVPLPPGSLPHPQACDTLSYLRWRAVDGPRSSADAERVLVAQPGVFEGAGAFDSVARNTVARGRRLGTIYRILGTGSSVELLGGPHRGRRGLTNRIVRYRGGLLFRRRRGRRSPVQRVRRRRGNSVVARSGTRANPARRIRRAADRIPRPSGAQAKGAVRRAFAGRLRHRLFRGVGLRRESGNHRGRRIQPVLRLFRARHHHSSRTEPAWPPGPRASRIDRRSGGSRFTATRYRAAGPTPARGDQPRNHQSPRPGGPRGQTESRRRQRPRPTTARQSQRHRDPANPALPGRRHVRHRTTGCA